MKENFERITVPLFAVLVLAFLMQGCAGKVVAVTPSATTTERDRAVYFTVTGTGDCTKMRVSWGDGQPPFETSMNFDNHPEGMSLPHSYYGWGGPKTVTAEGVTNCGGKAQTSIIVQPHPFVLAVGFPFQNGSCGAVPNVLKLRKNSLVKVSTSDLKVNYGCLLSGCVYDSFGEPNSVAPAGYPFPGLRKYSLVIRVGTQVVQGSSKDFTFTADQEAMLEVCENDDAPSDNVGAWKVVFEVVEPAL